LETNIQTVAIIGLEPAGATLARLLEPQYSVIALDKMEGISYALNSAFTLSKVFNSNPIPLHCDYAARMRGVGVNLLMRHVKSLFYYNPLARWLIMKSGLGSIHVQTLLGDSL